MPEPVVTLWAMLSQALLHDVQRSRRAAVARVATYRAVAGQEVCSTSTAAYCRTRAKIPAIAVQRLAQQVARGCESSIPEEWRCHTASHFRHCGHRDAYGAVPGSWRSPPRWKQPGSSRTARHQTPAQMSQAAHQASKRSSRMPPNNWKRVKPCATYGSAIRSCHLFAPQLFGSHQYHNTDQSH